MAARLGAATSVYEYASTGYMALLEIRPNELMLVRDELGCAWSCVNRIHSVKIIVTAERADK